MIRPISYTKNYNPDFSILAEILCEAEKNNGEITFMRVLHASSDVLSRHGIDPDYDIFYYQSLLRLSLKKGNDWWHRLEQEMVRSSLSRTQQSKQFKSFSICDFPATGAWSLAQACKSDIPEFKFQFPSHPNIALLDDDDMHISELTTDLPEATNSGHHATRYQILWNAWSQWSSMVYSRRINTRMAEYYNDNLALKVFLALKKGSQRTKYDSTTRKQPLAQPGSQRNHFLQLYWRNWTQFLNARRRLYCGRMRSTFEQWRLYMIAERRDIQKAISCYNFRVSCRMYHAWYGYICTCVALRLSARHIELLQQKIIWQKWKRSRRIVAFRRVYHIIKKKSIIRSWHKQCIIQSDIRLVQDMKSKLEYFHRIRIHCQNSLATKQMLIYDRHSKRVLILWNKAAKHQRGLRLSYEWLLDHHHNILLNQALSNWRFSFTSNTFRRQRSLKLCKRVFINWKIELRSAQTRTLGRIRLLTDAWDEWKQIFHRESRQRFKACQFSHNGILRRYCTVWIKCTQRSVYLRSRTELASRCLQRSNLTRCIRKWQRYRIKKVQYNCLNTEASTHFRFACMFQSFNALKDFVQCRRDQRLKAMLAINHFRFRSAKEVIRCFSCFRQDKQFRRYMSGLADGCYMNKLRRKYFRRLVIYLEYRQQQTVLFIRSSEHQLHRLGALSIRHWYQWTAMSQQLKSMRVKADHAYVRNWLSRIMTRWTLYATRYNRKDTNKPDIADFRRQGTASLKREVFLALAGYCTLKASCRDGKRTVEILYLQKGSQKMWNVWKASLSKRRKIISMEESHSTRILSTYFAWWKEGVMSTHSLKTQIECFQHTRKFYQYTFKMWNNATKRKADLEQKRIVVVRRQFLYRWRLAARRRVQHDAQVERAAEHYSTTGHRILLRKLWNRWLMLVFMMRHRRNQHLICNSHYLGRLFARWYRSTMTKKMRDTMWALAATKYDATLSSASLNRWKCFGIMQRLHRAKCDKSRLFYEKRIVLRSLQYWILSYRTRQLYRARSIQIQCLTRHVVLKSFLANWCRLLAEIKRNRQEKLIYVVRKWRERIIEKIQYRAMHDKARRNMHMAILKQSMRQLRLYKLKRDERRLQHQISVAFSSARIIFFFFRAWRKNIRKLRALDQSTFMVQMQLRNIQLRRTLLWLHAVTLKKKEYRSQHSFAAAVYSKALRKRVLSTWFLQTCRKQQTCQKILACRAWVLDRQTSDFLSAWRDFVLRNKFAHRSKILALTFWRLNMLRVILMGWKTGFLRRSDIFLGLCSGIHREEVGSVFMMWKKIANLSKKVEALRRATRSRAHERLVKSILCEWRWCARFQRYRHPINQRIKSACIKRWIQWVTQKQLHIHNIFKRIEKKCAVNLCRRVLQHWHQHVDVAMKCRFKILHKRDIWLRIQRRKELKKIQFTRVHFQAWLNWTQLRIFSRTSIVRYIKAKLIQKTWETWNASTHESIRWRRAVTFATYKRHKRVLQYWVKYSHCRRSQKNCLFYVAAIHRDRYLHCYFRQWWRRSKIRSFHQMRIRKLYNTYFRIWDWKLTIIRGCIRLSDERKARYKKNSLHSWRERVIIWQNQRQRALLADNYYLAQGMLRMVSRWAIWVKRRHEYQRLLHLSVPFVLRRIFVRFKSHARETIQLREAQRTWRMRVYCKVMQEWRRELKIRVFTVKRDARLIRAIVSCWSDWTMHQRARQQYRQRKLKAIFRHWNSLTSAATENRRSWTEVLVQNLASSYRLAILLEWKRIIRPLVRFRVARTQSYIRKMLLFWRGFVDRCRRFRYLRLRCSRRRVRNATYRWTMFVANSKTLCILVRYAERYYTKRLLHKILFRWRVLAITSNWEQCESLRVDIQAVRISPADNTQSFQISLSVPKSIP